MMGLRSSEISLTWFLCSLIFGYHYVFSSSLLQSQTRLKSYSDFPGRINITAAAAATTANIITITINTNPAAAVAAITTINSTESNHEEYTIKLPRKYIAFLQAASNIFQTL